MDSDSIEHMISSVDDVVARLSLDDSERGRVLDEPDFRERVLGVLEALRALENIREQTVARRLRIGVSEREIEGIRVLAGANPVDLERVREALLTRTAPARRSIVDIINEDV